MTNADEAIQPSEMKAAWTVKHDGQSFIVVKHYEGDDGGPPFEVIEHLRQGDDPDGRFYSLDKALEQIARNDEGPADDAERESAEQMGEAIDVAQRALYEAAKKYVLAYEADPDDDDETYGAGCALLALGVGAGYSDYLNLWNYLATGTRQPNVD